MSVFQFYKEQSFKVDRNELWKFISNPGNLAKITPPSMGFKITSPYVADNMYPGQIITYRVVPMLGIPVVWVTEITHVVENEYFVDEQRSGPYSIWHHEHRLVDEDEGVLMQDLITYKPPIGILGNFANRLFIIKTLNNIFEYRKKALEGFFGTQNY